jgi:rhodanese-related sulfurtransferase
MASNRISPEEVNARVLAGEPIIFLDSRNSKAWSESDKKVPGALRVPADDVESSLHSINRESTVLAYCTCPNEESSIKVAQKLSEKGFPRTLALRGGFDAWVAAGYPIEPKAKAA